jgi:hypothetical protein
MICAMLTRTHGRESIGADCDVVSQLNIADMMTHTYPLLPASGYPPNDDLKNESSLGTSIAGDAVGKSAILNENIQTSSARGIRWIERKLRLKLHVFDEPPQLVVDGHGHGFTLVSSDEIADSAERNLHESKINRGGRYVKRLALPARPTLARRH